MADRTIWLSRFLGSFALIVGSAMLFRNADYAVTMQLIVASRPLLLFVGVSALAAGLAMVLAHNVWSGSAAAVIVTVIGWLSTLRGIVVLMLPSDAAAGILRGWDFGALALFYGVVFVAVGAYLTYAGFAPKPREPA